MKQLTRALLWLLIANPLVVMAFEDKYDHGQMFTMLKYDYLFGLVTIICFLPDYSSVPLENPLIADSDHPVKTDPMDTFIGFSPFSNDSWQLSAVRPYLYSLRIISHQLYDWLNPGWTSSGTLRAWELESDKEVSKKLKSKVSLEWPAHPIYQPQLVMLYPVYQLPQSASPNLEKVPMDIPAENCAICIEPLTDDKQIIKTTCNHFFHISCLQSCFRNKSECPVCRADLETLSNFMTDPEQYMAQIEEKKTLQNIEKLIEEVRINSGVWTPDLDRQIIPTLLELASSKSQLVCQRAAGLRRYAVLFSLEHFLRQFMAGCATWSEDWVICGLSTIREIQDPALAQRIKQVNCLAHFYSAQHILSQVREEKRSWPADSDFIFQLLLVAQSSCNNSVQTLIPDFHRQVQNLFSLYYLYRIRHFLQIAEASKTSPRPALPINLWLLSAESSIDPEISQKAKELRPWVDIYLNNN